MDVYSDEKENSEHQSGSLVAAGAFVGFHSPGTACYGLEPIHRRIVQIDFLDSVFSPTLVDPIWSIVA